MVKFNNKNKVGEIHKYVENKQQTPEQRSQRETPHAKNYGIQ